MQMMEIGKKKAEGLDMLELEAFGRAELLPDRIEMHIRKRTKRTNRRWNCRGGTTVCIKRIG